MKRTIYLGSAARSRRATNKPTHRDDLLLSYGDAGTAGDKAPGVPLRERIRNLIERRRTAALLVACFFLAFLATYLFQLLQPETAELTPDEVLATVGEAIDEYASLPAVTSRAYGAVAPSVVRVRRLSSDRSDEREQGVGTGVVIQATGEILTNLHVVAGAERISVVFANGFETPAQVTGAQPDDDLAILTPNIVPEGVPPATMGSTAGLRPGDQVVAVGHPFGIGPSVSAGIVSGLGRSYASLDGSVVLDNLIQFDAAANPGNSGGPLVNRSGEVVGIVTSILNPTNETVFVGIGFAVPIETAAAAAGPNPF